MALEALVAKANVGAGTDQLAVVNTTAGKAMLATYKGKKGAQIDYIIHLLRIPELVEENMKRISVLHSKNYWRGIAPD